MKPNSNFANLYFKQLQQSIEKYNAYRKLDGMIQFAARAEIELEELVSLGEIALCGSTGGFDFEGRQKKI